jgi:hypothetical protein
MADVYIHVYDWKLDLRRVLRGKTPLTGVSKEINGCSNSIGPMKESLSERYRQTVPPTNELRDEGLPISLHSLCYLF